jgi:virginiamycin B lyase
MTMKLPFLNLAALSSALTTTFATTLTAALLAGPAGAVGVRVTDPQGKPLATVMVSRQPVKPALVDTSDNGYAASGKPQQAFFEVARFTDASGRTDLPGADHPWQVRLRKPGYQDRLLASTALGMPLVMHPELDPAALAAQQPANAWASTIDFGDADMKKEFMLQCNFCHQQGSVLLRRDRSKEEWEATIKRMVRYGARLSTESQGKLPALLEAHWKNVNANPALVPQGTPWSAKLANTSIREMPIGDAMSQMHDLLLHSNGMVYVGDNLQDRVYEIDPATGKYTVYKIPPQPGDKLGGLLAGRLHDFPKHETYQGIHSLAESPKDKHIFITPSYQRRLIEFNPDTKAFSVHPMDSGFYPHTVRFDKKDRVWFTLALSNQVGMYDRTTQKYTLYDLPFRSLMERITVKLTPFIFKLLGWGFSVANYVKVDHESTGVPLPYGMEVTPDGKAWIARVHTNEIGSVDPETGAVTMIKTPFKAPRRLRADRDGNLWIVAFNESKIARYAPTTGEFTLFDLPLIPKGSDTPYSLNVDVAKHQVWVNGTNSDSIYRLDIATQTWLQIPMQRRVTFTRDVEISPQGKVYVTSASFPSWHIEDAQPTLIEITAP